MQADFGKTAKDYAQFRAGFPPSLFARLATFGIGSVGQRIVDLGTGTGTLARSFAGQGCRVIGIDPAQPMLEAARRLDEQVNVQVEYRNATAEAASLPDNEADVVTAGQCWHWFNRPVAAEEVKRILKPGGLLVIAHLDWLPLKDNVVELTENLIMAHNPSWNLGGGCGIYEQWFRDVAEAGFTNIESFTYDVPVPYTHESWRGRIRASVGISASLSPEQVAVFDAELQALLQTRFPNPDMSILHRIFTLISQSPS